MYNVKNTIIKNIFSDEEINKILINSLNSRDIVFKEKMGQRLYRLDLPEEIKQKVTDIAKIHSGVNSLVLTEWCYCVYMPHFSEEGKINPKLIPHVDQNMGGKRITLDVQVCSNTSWPINVLDTEYILEDNDALLFSGTDQMHGRPEKIFQHKEYVGMLFLHFSY
jgi:hypothetical protein